MAAKNRGLGRGLDALFADQAPIINPESENKNKTTDKEGIRTENAIVYININDIKPNENQPRKNIDENKNAEHAASITELALSV